MSTLICANERLNISGLSIHLGEIFKIAHHLIARKNSNENSGV